ncbi:MULTISPECIES: hypothetical protein [unclassified Rhizobium]|uniref:hypothetical protein n=1 Tax=unclassified Rhizobium TaxID=2613769 RepID=UPI001FFE2525|nr:MULTISPECIES: hypothetical protein [unclassified Rhizobium]
MVERTVCATTPPQVEYALSELGLSLSEPCGSWRSGRSCFSQPFTTIECAKTRAAESARAQQR